MSPPPLSYLASLLSSASMSSPLSLLLGQPPLLGLYEPPVDGNLCVECQLLLQDVLKVVAHPPHLLLEVYSIVISEPSENLKNFESYFGAYVLIIT